MFEKVNPSHPDKVADRIAGAIVDLAYKKKKSPKVAVEVLIGHGKCFIINETNTSHTQKEIESIVKRIANIDVVEYREVKQDIHLSKNQSKEIRCGDNGIFKGMPVTNEQVALTKFVKMLYFIKPYDGKYIIDHFNRTVIACQSNIDTEMLKMFFKKGNRVVVNPLGNWKGGLDVDSGATNRKLGSDMGDSVTGGGLHGKDLSKADVSINIYCWLKAQRENQEFKLCCAIGDKEIDGKPYSEIVEIAKNFIDKLGGFEKFAEWGLIR